MTTEARTEAGRALLRSDFDTTGWGPRLVREAVTRAVLAIEEEAAQHVLEIMDDEIGITDRRKGHVTDLKYNVRQRIREERKAR